MRTIQRQIVSELIFPSDNKLFMGKKDPKKGGVYSDCWHIPGGGVDDGEDYVEALVREIKEETGLTIDQVAVELVDNTGTGKSEKTLKENNEKVICEMTFWVYKVQIKTTANHTQIQLKDDLVEFKWVNLDDLHNYKLTPPSIRLFKKLGYID